MISLRGLISAAVSAENFSMAKVPDGKTDSRRSGGESSVVGNGSMGQWDEQPDHKKALND